MTYLIDCNLGVGVKSLFTEHERLESIYRYGWHYFQCTIGVSIWPQPVCVICEKQLYFIIFKEKKSTTIGDILINVQNTCKSLLDINLFLYLSKSEPMLDANC